MQPITLGELSGQTRRDVALPSWSRIALQDVQPLFGAAPSKGAPGPAAPSVSRDPVEVELEIERRVQKRLSELRGASEREGRAAGEAAGRAELAQAAERLEQVMRELSVARAQLLDAAKLELRRLAVVIAEAILEHELAQHETYAVEAVSRALALVGESEETEIRVSPSDYAAVAQARAQLAEQEPRAGRLVVMADQNVASGCVVQSRSVVVDGTVAARLAEVRRALAEGAMQ